MAAAGHAPASTIERSGRGAGEGAEAEGEQRDEAPDPADDAADDRSRTPAQAAGARRRHSTPASTVRHDRAGASAIRTRSARPDRDRHRVEVGRTDGDLLVLERLVQEREQGAEQDHEGEADEEQVVEQERALPTERRVDPARRADAVAPPGDESEADHHDEQEEADQQRSEGRVAEGVHRLDDARSG